MKRLVRQAWKAASRCPRWALDFVYPPVCPLCEVDVSGPTFDESILGSPVLCGPCQEAVAPAIPYACVRCGAPVGPFLETAVDCVRCRKERFGFDALIRLGVYRDLLRTACTRIKKVGCEPLAAALAELLWTRENSAFLSENIELVVAIPHHWSQRISRVHYPSETVARVLARRLHVPFGTNILLKTRRTPAQTSLSGRGRRRNLRDAFRVARGIDLTDATLLLVDDVLTTGTTVNEAASVLRARGAKRVVVAILARGLGGTARG